METRAHFVWIGAFALSVIVGAFLFVLWFSGVGRITDRRLYQVRFSGSVSGLSRGSAVLFNGMKVGEVTAIDFLENDPGRVAAIIDINSRAPVKIDTKARLELQGLTGASAIALIGGAMDASPIEATSGALPVIEADRSDFQNLLENVQKLSARAEDTFGKLDALIAQSGPALNDTIQNVAKFSRALGDNAGGVNNFLAAFADLSQKLGPATGHIATLSDDIDKLVKAVDPEKVKTIVANGESFSATLAQSKTSLNAILDDAASLTKRLNESSTKIDGALKAFSDAASAFDGKKIAGIVDNVGGFAQALGENKGSVDHMLKDAAELSAKLNASADKVDALMASLQGFVGSPDTQGALTQVGEAAKSVRRLADDLNARTRDIASGLSRFSGSGLREYEALAIDGRRVINDFDRMLQSLQKNPSQLIFGAKPALPEYRGAN